jgi:nucleotide-binding universal stress UspA family protein
MEGGEMYQKILAPLDGSPLSECTLEHVKAIAAGCNAQRVVVLRVVEPVHAQDMAAYAEAGTDVDLILREAEAGAKSYVDRVVAGLRQSGIAAEGLVKVGWPADTIIQYAAENSFDLIIMSTHGRSGITRFFMGSVAERVTRHSPIPVLTVTPPGCRVPPPAK